MTRLSDVTYFELFLKHEAEVGDLEDAIVEWHQAKIDLSVYDYLGLPSELYYVIFLFRPDLAEKLRPRKRRRK